MGAVGGAATGVYDLALLANASISTDVAAHPGQDVRINGDRDLPAPPTWGSGGFTIGEAASLSVGYLQVPPSPAPPHEQRHAVRQPLQNLPLQHNTRSLTVQAEPVPSKQRVWPHALASKCVKVSPTLTPSGPRADRYGDPDERGRGRSHS